MLLPDNDVHFIAISDGVYLSVQTEFNAPEGKSINFKNIFTSRKNCDIITTPNKLNIQSIGCIFPSGISIPFFDDTIL